MDDRKEVPPYQPKTATVWAHHENQEPQNNIDDTGPKGYYQLPSELSLLLRIMDRIYTSSYISLVSLSTSALTASMKLS